MVDLEKAFDSVWIDNLLLKMHYLVFNGTVWSLIRNFLKERKFLIRIDGVKSTEFTSTIGLPQGSVLSPIEATHTYIYIYIYELLKSVVVVSFRCFITDIRSLRF